jgi:DNA replication and repair protein RecF
MHLRRIRLESFRNIAFASVDFEGDAHFFVGLNGQGKTNLLEAVGYLSALRSFRTASLKPLIRHEASRAQLYYEIEYTPGHREKVVCRIASTGRQLEHEGTPVARLSDYIGRFPTVVLCIDDLQLVRGAPAERRRLMDMSFSACDPAYYEALVRYHRSLAERNSLLKRQTDDPALYRPFERVMAEAAAPLLQTRRESLGRFNALLAQAYRSLAGEVEVPALHYLPGMPDGDVAALRAYWEERRERDRRLKNTAHGVHRDDFGLTLQGHPARDYASEGQQRCLAIALRIAQAVYLEEKSGTKPILLADDILGELDPERRARFWTTVGHGYQIIATGTRAPEDEGRARWRIHQVEGGTFSPPC